MLSSAGASMEHSSLHLMRTATRPSIPDLKCCCGQLECAYLKHNNAALEGLEKGLADCGAIGQVRSHAIQ